MAGVLHPQVPCPKLLPESSPRAPNSLYCIPSEGPSGVGPKHLLEQSWLGREETGQTASQTTLQRPRGSVRTGPGWAFEPLWGALGQRQVPEPLASGIVCGLKGTATGTGVDSVFTATFISVWLT